MRIAIDARELAGKPTGVGRYLAEQLRGWSGLAGAAAHEFVLCAPESLARTPALASLDGLRLAECIAPGHGPLWEQVALPRLVSAAAADVLFAPAYSGPVLGRVPMVLTIHDVSFAAHPEWFPWREGLRRRLTTRWAAHRATRVLTVSDFSKREIVRLLGVSQEKIDVIYSGATPLAGPRPAMTPPAAPMVLYVGSIFARRHVTALVDGFARVARRQPGLTLEIVGDNRSTPPVDVAAAVAASGLGDRIRIRSYVTDRELSDLYARATAFAFLSEYEGFGMTPLDALAAQVPIVVLDTEVAREIYGPAAVYVPTPAPEAVEDALALALFDPGERARLQEAGRTMVTRYSWHECAQRTLQALLAAPSL